MKFLADLHIHTDFNEETGRRHGERPETVAQALVNSRLDVAAITEHNQFSDRYNNVREEVERLSETTTREIVLLLGVELSMRFEEQPFHVGYIFESSYDPYHLPSLPDSFSDINELGRMRKQYPGITILFHPSWKDGESQNRFARTNELMQSGLVDGIEVLNGSILSNGAPVDITKRGIEAFLVARERDYHLAPIGCSDAHKASLIGGVVTSFAAAEKTGIFDEVREGRTMAKALDPSIRKKVRNIAGQFPRAGKYITWD